MFENDSGDHNNGSLGGPGEYFYFDGSIEEAEYLHLAIVHEAVFGRKVALYEADSADA
jgi:hypothetical protein